MKTLIVATWLLLYALLVSGQTTPAGAQARQSASPAAANAPASPNSSARSVEAVPSRTDSDAEQEKIRELTHRVEMLEVSSIQKSGNDSTRVAIITAIIAASAVFGAALIGIFGQYFMAGREERRAVRAAQQAAELARQEAIYRHTEKILEFRLKQMELFFAPMFALLRQSLGLYEKMLYQLVQDEPKRYREVTVTGKDDYRFQVLDEHGEWQGFRLLDQFPAIRRNPKAFSLAEGILDIGAKMTKIISEHAGLASEDLMDTLGEYMAHYAILSTIYKLGETVPYEPGWHTMGYYPRQLNVKIEAGYRQLSQFLDEYAEASKRMLEALPNKEGTQRSA
jgi:hypothetical protein